MTLVVYVYMFYICWLGESHKKQQKYCLWTFKGLWETEPWTSLFFVKKIIFLTNAYTSSFTLYSIPSPSRMFLIRICTSCEKWRGSETIDLKNAFTSPISPINQSQNLKWRVVIIHYDRWRYNRFQGKS